MTIQNEMNTNVFEQAEEGITINAEIARLTAELDAIKAVVRDYAQGESVDFKKVEIETAKGTVGVTFTKPKASLAPKSEAKVAELEKHLNPAAFNSIFEEVTITKTEIRLRDGYEETLNFLSDFERHQVEKLIKVTERAPAVTFPKPPKA